MSESPIKTPRQLITIVALAFFVPITLIVLLSQLVTGGDKGAKESDVDIIARIQPVGQVKIAEASAPKGQSSGEQVFNQVCKNCHETGVAGAPKVGDKAAWAKLIAQGQSTLVDHAIKGIRGMPPKGGNPDLDNVEVERAVVYMANKAGASWKEPETSKSGAPVAAAPAAAAVAAPAPSAAAPTPSAAAPAPSAAAPAPSAAAPAPSAAAPAPSAAASKASAAAPTPSAAASKASAAAPTPSAAGAPAPAASAATKPDGKKAYDTTCAICHGAGIAGAPKFGDKAAWASRLKTGMDALYTAAIAGKNAMPPKGGNPALADAELKAAVDYMVAAVK